MRHRAPQSILTRGLIGGSPLAMVTGGVVQPRNRFRYAGTKKTLTADGGVDYRNVFESQVAAADTELVVGEYVDDLAVLGGTAT